MKTFFYLILDFKNVKSWKEITKKYFVIWLIESAYQLVNGLFMPKG